jgi:FkbM family methyltransferase
MNVLGKMASAALVRYYRSPGFPAKLRIWGWMRRWTGYSRIAVRCGANGWITLDELDLLQRCILAEGAYEPEVWESLASAARGNDVFWDIGAHIGSVSVQALGDERIRAVLAFEPDPCQFELLRLHLALNGGRGTAFAFALSDRRDSRPMRHGGSDNTGLSSLTAGPGAETFDVDCRTADELVFGEGLPAPTLVKIDVEGWESHVLDGFKRLLSEKPPRAIVFEADALESGELADHSIAATLYRLGYGVRHLRRRSGIVEVRENYLAQWKT